MLTALDNKMADEELSVRELLKNTYERLAKRHPHQELVLEGKPTAEIANDSDWHRTRIGYMRYETAKLFQFNDKTWAIARGEKAGSYPADPYDSDILALEFSTEGKSEEQIKEELEEKISRSGYFINSLVFGLADGRISANKNSPFTEKLFQLLSDISKFIAQKLEHDEELFYLDLRPAVSKEMRYTPEFVAYLTDSIEAVLQ